METIARIVSVYLACVLLSASGRVQENVFEGEKGKHLFVQRRSPLPGSPKKLYKLELDDVDEDLSKSSGSQQEDVAHKVLGRVRRSLNPNNKPNVTEIHLNDSHYQAYVHWAGDHRDTIVVLTRDPNPGIHSTSHVFISRNYGRSFNNRTNDFMQSNSSHALIHRFYPSPVDNKKYLFVDKQHKLVFRTVDDGVTFFRKSVPFTPDDILFHPTYSNVVLGYDRTRQKLYYSRSFGVFWYLKDENVRSYYWGIPPWDSASTLYIEREEISGGHSNVVKTDYFSNFATTQISGVNDFNLIDNYMFATKPSSTPGSVTLMVSLNRTAFQKAMIPTSQATKDFFVCDASENQVFLAVTHNQRTTHLYISDTSGIKYSLSLERVLYFSNNTSSAWLRRYMDHSFVDLHKVQGMRGVYIASQLSVGQVGRRRIMTQITFDKGGVWHPVAAPKVDNQGKNLNCSLPNCSLHLSQEFGKYFPYTRYSPMLSRSEAPGIIMAMGTYGQNLRLNADVFISSDAGLSWHMILKGRFYYNLGDHGGVFIAVPRGSPTNIIYYSWNEGETWLTYQFLNTTRMYVYGLLTEPGEQSAEFTIFGSHQGHHQWTVVQIDLRNVLGSLCKLDDYKQWVPSDEQNGTCLLGRKTTYERRIAHAHCYNGYDYDRPITSENCPCDREDFECDYGYVPSWNVHEVCVFDSSSGVTPTRIPPVCPKGSTYQRTQGYRKVVGDTCQGGLEDLFAPETVSCPIPSLPEFLLYAARTSIKRVTLGDNTQTTIPLGSQLKNAIALDFDYQQNCIYWADITLDTIKRSFLNGSGIIETLHGGMQQVEGLALDWLGDNIYWVDAGAKKIEVSRADGRFRRSLFSSSLDQPRAIVLDPKRGYMYWTDWGSSARIEKAFMSGQGRAPLISSSLRWPNGIAIDYSAQKLYWTDAGLDKIERSNLDGTLRETVLASGVPHPYAISIFEESMYWDDWSTQSIEKAAKRDGSDRQTIVSRVVGLMDLKVFHQDVQKGNNSCSQLQPCGHLCLAAPGSFACACPDNMKTVMSASGLVRCECNDGEYMDSNGECTARSGTCGPNQFKCDNSRCIPSHWKCDHDNDCGDMSDERGCNYTTCQPFQFRCDSGLCIRASWRCDHDNDCHDNSDERNCPNVTCASNQFTCNNNRCIPSSWVCDFDDDCRDGSDEQGCTPTPTTPPSSSCRSTQFACNNGRCIPRRWYCDGDNDCGDRSDEPSNCSVSCSSSQFTCSNGNCISRNWVCDGDDDCGDRSDERNCNLTTTSPATASPWTRPTSCHSWEYQCRNHYCVYQWDVCDGVDDCGDGSDEDQCATTPSNSTTPTPSSRICHYWEFTCSDGKCINNGFRCDGVNNCGDGSDERGCPTPSTRGPTTPTVQPCPSGWLKCLNDPSSICIRREWLCDGVSNCPQSWDERPANCLKSTVRPITCPSNSYQCSSGICIPRNFLCDGFAQCPDGSDEIGCPSVLPCTGFKCDGGKLCLPAVKRCDGFQDCTDGTDEQGCGDNLQVQNLTATARQDGTTMDLSWPAIKIQPPGVIFNGYRTAYRAQVIQSVHVSDVWHERLADGNNYDHVKNLKPCSQYEFKVQLLKLNSAPGPYSAAVGANTATVKTSAPQNVHHALVDDNKLRITWDAPEVICRPITTYMLAYKRTFTATRFTNLRTGTGQSYLLTGLSIGVSYQIKVQAYNLVDGEGMFSPVETVQITRPQIPKGPVTNLRGTPTATSVQLKWGAPHSASTTIPVAGYTVYESTPGGLSPLANVTTNSYTVKSLQSGTSYYFAVKPYSKQGYGPSAVVLVKTTGGDPPVNLKAEPVNKTAITLTWTRPPGSTPQQPYYIYYGTVTSGVSSNPVGHTTATTFTVTNLQNTVYMFEVSVGTTGRKTLPINSRPITDSDYQPVHSLTAKLVNSSTIVLSWEPPTQLPPASTIQNYQIKESYRDKAIVSENTYNTADKKTTYTFRYRKFNTIYTYTVRTRFASGDLGEPVHTVKTTGPFSAPVGPLISHLDDINVNLTWSAPPQIAPKDLRIYSIHWTCPRCYGAQSGAASATNTSYKFFNLDRGRVYQFTVHALTVYGSGQNSAISVTIPISNGPVRNLKLTAGNYTVTLTWDPPIGIDTKHLQGYVVSWCDDCPRYFHSHHTTSVGADPTNFVQNVLAGSDYKFSVQVNMSSGLGQMTIKSYSSAPLPYKLSYAYSHLQNYNRRIYIHWYRPSGISGHVGYEVTWKCVGCYYSSSRTVNTTNFSLNSTRYGTAYKFDIRVVTALGKGEAYEKIVSIPALKGVPTDFYADVVGKTLTFRWTPPTDISPFGFYHYSLRYKCDSCRYDYFHYGTIYNYNQTSYNVSVTAGERYIAKIQCHTRYGFGQVATTTISVPAISIGAVNGLKAVHDSTLDTKVTLSWEAPSNVSFYHLLYYIVSVDCLDCTYQKRFDTNFTTITQTFQCGSTYEVTVKAVTDQGSGKESPTTFKTKGTVGVKVTNLTANFTSDNTTGPGFVMTWGRPANVHTKIEGYYIRVLNETKHLVFSNTTFETKQFVKGSNMAPGHSYFFQVRCKTSCGYGEEDMTFAFYPGAPPSPSSPSSLPPLPTAGKQTGEKKKLNAAVWAVPVAIVGLLLILAVVYFGRKARRLETSMFALMTRRSMEDEAGVTFHSDDDIPIIQGFSDDEALVTA